MNVTDGPASRVRGASGMPSPSTAALAMRLTPSGKFWRSLKSGFERVARLWAAAPKYHSNACWSCTPCER